MIVVHAFSPLGFVCRVDSKKVVRDFREVCPISFRVEEACIELQLGAVIIGEGVAIWRRIGNALSNLPAHLSPHRPFRCPYG